MKSNFKTFSLAALLILASVSAEAVVAPHSKTIVVESPENLPILAQSDAEAMYLHDTNDGRTLLYVETKNGQELTALDVTDPSRIQRIAQTELPATSAYDFVRNVGDTSVVIRYRNGSGAALISFRHTKRPQLTTSIALSGTETSEPLGATAFLVSSGESSQILGRTSSYKVVDTSNAMHPAVFANISQVQQVVSKPDTGTLFFLNKNGVSVVRRLQVEEEHQIELDQMRGN